jgi:hypothetical protein
MSSREVETGGDDSRGKQSLSEAYDEEAELQREMNLSRAKAEFQQGVQQTRGELVLMSISVYTIKNS